MCIGGELLMIYGLPERLKELREKYGYSQSYAANRLGVSSSVVSAYERGDRTPSAIVLLKISYLYNCSTDQLLGRTEQEASPSLIDVSDITEEQLKVINELLKIFRKSNNI